MSDWKSRARVVGDAEVPKAPESDWKSRAIPVSAKDVFENNEPSRDQMIEELRQSQKQYTPGKTAWENFRNAAVFGGRAGLEGLGAGLGMAQMYPYLPENMSFSEKMDAILKAGKEEAAAARKESREELEAMSAQNPKAALFGKVAGIAGTAPLGGLSARGLLTMGAIGGAGEAASSAESPSEAALDVVLGAGGSLIGGKTLEGLGIGASGLARGLRGGIQASEGGLAGATGEAIGQGMRKLGIPQAAETIGGGIASAGKTVAEKAGKGALKVASGLTGVSENEIKAFANQSEKVLDLAKTFKDDTLGMVDNFRRKVSTNIGLAKARINESIGSELANSTKRLSTEPVLAELQLVKSKLHPKLHAEEIAEIDDIVNMVQSLGKDVSASEMNMLKRKLQDMGRSGYVKNGKIFSPGTEVTNAAKQAARKSRLLLDEAEPGVRAANRQLEQLHKIEDTMNPNLLKEGAAPASVLGAGAGSDKRSLRTLQRLGEFTGTPVAEEAANIAAARTFGSPEFLPTYSTGKALAGVAAGAGLGYMAEGKEGALAGAALTSPMALKYAILTGKIPASVLRAVPSFTGKITDEVVEQAFKKLGGTVASRGGQSLANTLSEYLREKEKKKEFDYGNKTYISPKQAQDMFLNPKPVKEE